MEMTGKIVLNGKGEGVLTFKTGPPAPGVDILLRVPTAADMRNKAQALFWQVHVSKAVYRAQATSAPSGYDS